MQVAIDHQRALAKVLDCQPSFINNGRNICLAQEVHQNPEATLVKQVHPNDALTPAAYDAKLKGSIKWSDCRLWSVDTVRF